MQSIYALHYYQLYFINFLETLLIAFGNIIKNH